MKAFEFLVMKKSEYDWPILKGKAKDSVLVRFVREDSRGRWIFKEETMGLGDWNVASKLHNRRKRRKRGK